MLTTRIDLVRIRRREGRGRRRSHGLLEEPAAQEHDARWESREDGAAHFTHRQLPLPTRTVVVRRRITPWAVVHTAPHRLNESHRILEVCHPTLTGRCLRAEHELVMGEHRAVDASEQRGWRPAGMVRGGLFRYEDHWQKVPATSNRICIYASRILSRARPCAGLARQDIKESIGLQVVQLIEREQAGRGEQCTRIAMGSANCWPTSDIQQDSEHRG